MEALLRIFDGNLDPYYKGDIYVDLVIDENDSRFSQLKEILESEDEAPKIEGVSFNFYLYEDTLDNKEFYLKSLEKI